MVGTNYLDSNGTYYGIDQFITHENHDNPRYANDVAVVRTNQTIAFDEKVQSIRCSTVEVREGVIAQLFGWGLVVSVGKFNILHLRI